MDFMTRADLNRFWNDEGRDLKKTYVDAIADHEGFLQEVNAIIYFLTKGRFSGEIDKTPGCDTSIYCALAKIGKPFKCYQTPLAYLSGGVRFTDLAMTVALRRLKIPHCSVRKIGGPPFYLPTPCGTLRHAVDRFQKGDL